MGKLQGLMDDYALSMTAHGVGRIARASSFKTKIFWTVVWVTMMVMFFLQTTTLLRRFLAYPKSVRLEMANQPVPFPAVSICNLRPLDAFTLKDAVFRDNLTFRWQPGNYSYTGRPGSSDFERYIIKYGNVYTSYRFYTEVLLEAEHVSSEWYWEARRALFSRLTLAANFNAQAAEQGGMQATQFIAKCEYAGKKCTYENFTYFLDPAYFNCFTFDMNQMGWEGQTIYEGPDHGLSLVLFIPSITALDLSPEVYRGIALTQELSFGGEGIRLVIHEQNTVPYPLTDGLDIPRGVSASVGVQVNHNFRLSPPYGNCTAKNTLPGTLVNYTYTMASCKKTCLQALIAETCGCTDVALPLSQDFEEKACYRFDDIPKMCRDKPDIRKNLDYCRAFFEPWFKRYVCKLGVRTSISKNLSAWQQCKCYPRCHDVAYQTSISLSDWPAIESLDFLMKDILQVAKFADHFPPEKAKQYFGTLPSDPQPSFETYRAQLEAKNWLRVNLYISDTSVVKIEETEEYGFAQLISDIGGQLGLWIGVSVISIIEVCDLVFRICQYFLDPERNQTRHNGSTVQKDEQNGHVNHASTVKHSDDAYTTFTGRF